MCSRLGDLRKEFVGDKNQETALFLQRNGAGSLLWTGTSNPPEQILLGTKLEWIVFRCLSFLSGWFSCFFLSKT